MCSFKDLMKNDSPIGGAANVAKEARVAQSSDALNRTSAKRVSLGKLDLGGRRTTRPTLPAKATNPILEVYPA
jgi:hypothetical protein